MIYKVQDHALLLKLSFKIFNDNKIIVVFFINKKIAGRSEELYDCVRVCREGFISSLVVHPDDGLK